MAEAIKLEMEGMLLNWLKDVGDAVKAGEVIAEVEADKATVEIEAPADGVLIETNAEPGDELEEGAVIGSIGAEGESAGGDEGATAKEEEPEPEEEEAEPQADAEAESATQEQEQPEPATNGNLPGGVKASPLARRVAEEKGVDLQQVKGTGPGGRIVREDVESFEPGDAPAAPPTDKPTPIPAGAAGLGEMPTRPVPTEDVELIDLTRMRKRIAQVTVESKQWTPHFYVTTDMDVEPLLALRKQLNASLEDKGVKISINDLIVKAAALTLKDYPNLNSHFYGDKIARHQRINIGIAVALPQGGLLNVVAKDADKVSLSTLAQTNKDMITRAREGKIKPDDLEGATFTVSNLGIYDVDFFSAIISPPEAAILAVGSAKKVPVVLEDGTLGVGTRMKVTISVDHRVSDGAEGAEYMQAFKNLIEDPMGLVV